MQTLRTLGCGLTLLAGALMLPQPVAAQSTVSIPFAVQLVPAPNCSTTSSFALIYPDRSLQIVIVGLRCGPKLVTGTVTLKALQVRLSDEKVFEAGTTSTTLFRGNGLVTAPAGGGTLLANCGTGDPSAFGTTCQSLIIAVEDPKTGAVKEATGVP